MEHDIYQSISQGNYGTNAPQIGRMEEVANLLYSCCCKDETESHSRTTYRGNLYSEQSIIEKYADEHHCWYTIDEVLDFGVLGPSGKFDKKLKAKYPWLT